ncbi:pentatricopeptide repeat-containing protein At2g35030, mitochondrial-like [Capsicum annuum]|uniref:pentatricopeptide repeat-containing protein At2g35030, mitochondrial-like n=1 Tax=Capsicum annuum TaxID=4072 RepID=UPI001FB17D4E|nr:pentatricopeptide repeat-containing protein At2g35030, mitochondrial-like [Capsicum annuum]
MHETDVFSWTSMLVAYIRASRLAEACSLFDSMPVRNVVAWTALITGFAQNGEGEKALCVFKEMLEEGYYICIVSVKRKPSRLKVPHSSIKTLG